MDKKQRVRYWISLAIGLLVLTVLFLPKRLEQRECDLFAEPLYTHTLPEGSRLVQKSAVKSEDGSFTAALILASDMEAEELLDFFDDVTYPAAKEGQVVSLDVKPLDQESLEAMQKAGLKKEDETYYFVYIYSAMP